MKRKIIVVFFLIFILVGCNRYEEVAYKKPYLTLDNDFLDKLKVKMYDYETKESVDVKTYGFGEYTAGIYNKNNNDYLITDPHSCQLLIVHSNSNSELFDPCKITNTKNAIVGNFELNDDYLIITLNIGVEEEGKDYNYVLATFDNNYQLIDSFKVPGEVKGVSIFENKIMYSYIADFWDEKKLGKIGTYDLKTKDLLIEDDYTRNKGFFLKVKDNIYSVNDGVEGCKIYLNV